MTDNKIIHGDCLEVLKTLSDNSVDALVTDPPYGIRFMGKAWDGKDIEARAKRDARKDPVLKKDGKVRQPRVDLSSEAGKYDRAPEAMVSFQYWTNMWAKEVIRVLKPGAHALVFCSPRSYHRMACGLEDAGFDIRDQMQWLFGSGFPKSLNVAKAGAGKEWEGFGTALKPANEPICIARKPISEKTVAANVLKWGCGGLNIDGCRVESADQEKFAKNWDRESLTDIRGGKYGDGKPSGVKNSISAPAGRFPANLLLSCSDNCTDDAHDMFECPIAMLDEQSGVSKSGDRKPTPIKKGSSWKNASNQTVNYFKGDSGGASRFFYCAKASKRDKGNDNTHPTVKPTKLMRYLIRLVTPHGGLVLDPFAGSGSTGVAALKEGFRFIGIEREPEYVTIAQSRMDHAKATD